MNYFNYFSEIEEAFVRRRGRALFISSKDWVLIEAWKDRGIPLHIAIRAIDSVFDLFDKQAAHLKGATRNIGSLAFCQNEVEVQYAEWLTSQTGKSVGSGSEQAAGFTIEAVEGHIDGAVETLRTIARPDIAADISRAIAKLVDLRGRLTTDYEAVDAELNEIENNLDAAVLTSWTRAEFQPIQKAVAAQLAEYRESMDDDAYQNTFSLMLLKRLRETGGIPRLGLFYL